MTELQTNTLGGGGTRDEDSEGGVAKITVGKIPGTQCVTARSSYRI